MLNLFWSISRIFLLKFIKKPLLDNASVHKAKIIRERMPHWQKRGLFIFFLPPYSPHLNIAETIWRKLKKEWLDPQDYLEKDSLFYATNRCLANLGTNLIINYHCCPVKYF